MMTEKGVSYIKLFWSKTGGLSVTICKYFWSIIYIVLCHMLSTSVWEHWQTEVCMFHFSWWITLCAWHGIFSDNLVLRWLSHLD